MKNNSEPKRLLAEAQAMKESLTTLRRTLHENAEVGFHLPRTLQTVNGQLTALGLTPVSCGKAGVTATVGKGKPTFLLRADMDALPIREQSSLPFQCTHGNMHACGHDMHTAMLLGAAQLLKTHEKELNGTVKLMFQPAEEILEGAKDMTEAGVLQSPAPSAAMMIHVMTAAPLPAGSAVVADAGVSAPAADFFTVKIQGKGCHGATPHMGIDPITVAAQLVLAMQTVHARELAVGDKSVLTFGSVQAGQSANAIPDTAVLKGTLRAFSDQTRDYLKTRLKEISRLIARAHRATAKVTFTSGCPTLINDGALSEKVQKYLEELLGKKNVFAAAQLTRGNAAPSAGGSEDFSYVSHQVPSLMIALSAGEQRRYPYPLHHPKVRFDEEVLPVGAAIYAYAAMRFLEENCKISN